jgi:hypothetical protein
MWDITRGDEDIVEAKCPQCGSLMANMGKDFEAPRMNQVKEWQHLAQLYKVGITYHSCGCGGPGYIPATKEALVKYFDEQINEANEQLEFWRSRTEPSDQKELDREYSKHYDHIWKIPHFLRAKRAVVKNNDAIFFWIDRIKEIEDKKKLIV